MKAKIIISFYLFISLLSSAHAQMYNINGYIQDVNTKERLIGATILYDNLTFTTNNFGFFSFNCNKTDTIHLQVNYIGYETLNIKNQTNKDTFIVFELTKFDYKINDVVIDYKTNIKTLKSYFLISRDFKNLPMIGAEIDVMKGLQMLPGISQSTEGKSDIIVRGGSSDQNMILLDDAPIYYLNHLGGFVSIFNINIIKKIELFNSSFPAKYGGRLSSILDIRTIDGNMNIYKYDFTISPISTNFFIEGPIIKNKISVVISFRRTFFDILTKIYNFYTHNNISSLFFYDFNSKISFKINEKNKLNISFYKGDDVIKNSFYNNDSQNFTKYKFNRNIGNTLLSIKWTSKLNTKLFLNSTFSLSDFKYTTSNEYFNTLLGDTLNFKYQFNSSIFDFALNNLITYYISNSYTIDFGLNLIKHNYYPANIYYFENQHNNNLIDSSIMVKYNSYENIFFIENNFNIGQNLYFNIGLRFVNYIFSKISHNFLHPRIGAKFIINDKFSVLSSYTKTEQSVHLINFFDMGGESALWLPATNIAPPEISNIYTLGSEINISKKVNINIDFYYKTLENLIAFKFGTIQNNTLNWQENSAKNGKGKCYGIEILLKGENKKIAGWIAYTYSKTTRQFVELNNGNIYPYDFDRPHELKIFLVLKSSKSIDFSFYWIFQSGRPISLPTAFFNTIDRYNIIYNNNDEFTLYSTQYFDSKNSYRMRPYHRLDIAINFNKTKKNFTQTFSISIYNAYNQSNPYFYFFDTEYNNGKIIKKIYQQSLFPIIPSVSYNIKF